MGKMVEVCEAVDLLEAAADSQLYLHSASIINTTLAGPVQMFISLKTPFPKRKHLFHSLS